MKDVRLAILPISQKAYVGKLDNMGFFHPNKIDVTDDFKRCIVTFCTEYVEFEVDGIKFKATCERVD